MKIVLGFLPHRNPDLWAFDA